MFVVIDGILINPDAIFLCSGSPKFTALQACRRPLLVENQHAFFKKVGLRQKPIIFVNMLYICCISSTVLHSIAGDQSKPPRCIQKSATKQALESYQETNTTEI